MVNSSAYMQCTFPMLEKVKRESSSRPRSTYNQLFLPLSNHFIKISSKLIRNFLSKNLLTDRQTDKLKQKHNLLGGGNRQLNSTDNTYEIRPRHLAVSDSGHHYNRHQQQTRITRHTVQCFHNLFRNTTVINICKRLLLVTQL